MATLPALFSGVISNGQTVYVDLAPGDFHLLMVHIAWKDATSSATISLQTTGYDEVAAPVGEEGSVWEWFTEPNTITGPSGTAAGCSVSHLGPNFSARRARLKITAAADCNIDVFCERKRKG